MTVPNNIQKIIDNYEASGFPDYTSLQPVELRERYNGAFHSKPKVEPIAMAKVESHTIEGPGGELTLRCYYPNDAAKDLPALMYFHGGGFVIRDDMAIYDQTCRRMAARVGCVVIAVDYRLAPEAPFPAAPEDCYAATCWVAENSDVLGIDKERFGVWGESCGGNLATVIPVMARDRQGPKLACQIIVSPMLDIDFTTRSYREFATGYILTQETMCWFWKHYLSHEDDQKNPYALPNRASNLNNLPRALVTTTELDVLRDDGDVYAKLLEASNTEVSYQCYPGLIHGYFDLYAKVSQAKSACDDVMAWTKILLKV